MMLAGCGGNPGTEPVGLTFATISAGEFHTCGVRPNGAAYCWGGGDLGDGDSTGSAKPVAVSGDLAFATVSAGTGHTCGVTTAGSAYCWGINQFGELGTGTTMNSKTPAVVSGGLTFAAVRARATQTCGVTTAGAALYAHPNDERDLARAIAELIDDPRRGCELGAVGRRRVETELAWSHSIPKLLAAYRAALSG